MNTQSSVSTTPAIQELDLLPYINALISCRWWILAAVLFGAIATGLWVQQQPYQFESSAKVTVVDLDDPGGVSPDDRRASEVLTLVEHGFVMGTTHDNYVDVMLARLRSREFTMRFMDAHQTYRLFFPAHWDADRGQWVNGFEPDRGTAFTRFRDEVRSIEIDEETQIITVSMRWADAATARDLANRYVAFFNSHMRARAMDDVRRKQSFLNDELLRSDVVEIRQSIYRLIEAQTAIAMLANAREEYALELIDPAALAYRSYNMSRKKRTVVGAVASGLLGTFLVLASVLARRMYLTVAQLRRAQSGPGNAPGIPQAGRTSL